MSTFLLFHLLSVGTFVVLFLLQVTWALLFLCALRTVTSFCCFGHTCFLLIDSHSFLTWVAYLVLPSLWCLKYLFLVFGTIIPFMTWEYFLYFGTWSSFFCSFGCCSCSTSTPFDPFSLLIPSCKLFPLYHCMHFQFYRHFDPIMASEPFIPSECLFSCKNYAIEGVQGQSSQYIG